MVQASRIVSKEQQGEISRLQRMSRKHEKETQTGQGNRWNDEEDEERAAHTAKRKREKKEGERERERARAGSRPGRPGSWVHPRHRNGRWEKNKTQSARALHGSKRIFCRAVSHHLPFTSVYGHHPIRKVTTLPTTWYLQAY